MCLHYTIEICIVLEYLAGRKPPVVHNDIKPGNIIVDQHSGRAVLVDFGTAKTRYLAPAGDNLYGTVGYAAPELYQGHSEPRSERLLLGRHRLPPPHRRRPARSPQPVPTARRAARLTWPTSSAPP